MHFFIKTMVLYFGAVLLTITPAQSQIALSGYFIATDNCEAYQSFKKATNPGNVELVRDMSYELIGKNKVEATHYRIRVPHANPKERWVKGSCGFILTDCKKSGGAADTSENENTSPNYLLALSWQPAFCQTHQSKTECETQVETRYDATHFTLHGLWPQPKSNTYCNVTNLEKTMDKRKLWEQLPILDISPETYEDLIEVMPGVASYLHRHEWIKHGTCYSFSPEEYFAEAIMLTEQVNASAVRTLFAQNIGKTVRISDIKDRFDQAFGPGAGDKVKVKCSNGMVTELWITLKGEITSRSRLADLLKRADRADNSCREGLIDPVGY